MEQSVKPLQLDVEKILADKNPKIHRVLPGFVIRYLKRIAHQDGINDILRNFANLRGAAFNDAALGYMGITYRAHGVENLPKGGRNIFVSNHPLGGLDGMVFMSELTKHFPAIKFPVNDILLYIENYGDIFLPVNKVGTFGRDAAKLMDEAYASDYQLLNFPAGICSRKIKGVITDLPWQKSFIVKAVQHQRDIVPCYFAGRNSSFFYNLANFRTFIGLKMNLEMLYLVDEMFRQNGKDIDVYFGDPIPWQTFDKSRKPQEWADMVREKTYNLPERFKSS
ncbi:MAG: 1-acyl-sn-glycerol-3-phosphate acyltransferase [Bacteroidales bacterium]|jgi:putative hemolysin|nr:1-acyl-sn-glycerol-3-phosphate acyltransferase [Bacteroidales bacterium]MDX9927342.1 1-acyl-sn-glycerol-3-phosphate acyltransferase [Bacteroidales bacterium]